MRPLEREACCPLLRGRGERGTAVTASLTTAAIATAIATAPITAATLAAPSIATSAITATIAATAIASAAIASTISASIATTSIASSTIATAITTAVTTSATTADAVPSQLYPHLHAARVDLHARVRSLWWLRCWNGRLPQERNVARSLPALRAVWREALHDDRADGRSQHRMQSR